MKEKGSLMPVLALLLVTMIWGSGFVATTMAISAGTSTEWILVMRFIPGSILLLLLFFRRIRKTNRVHLIHGVVNGLMLFVAFFAQTAGQALTTVSTAAFLTSTYVIMIPFMEWILTRRRPDTRIFILSLLALLGILLLSLSDDMHLDISAGNLLILLCAVFYALEIFYLGTFCRGDDPVLLTFWQLLTVGILALCTVLVRGIPITETQFRGSVLPCLYLSVFPTTLCYFLQAWSQMRLPPAESSIIMSSEGMFGMGFSLILGLETFRWNMLFGGLLVTFSVIFVSGLPGGKKRAKKG